MSPELDRADHADHSDQPATCPRCGIERLRTEHGELCTACLFAAGMPESDEQRVGPYRLIEQLDAGGTGLVFVALRADDEDDPPVAIKLARPELLASPDAIAAFRTGLRIQHGLHGVPGVLSTRELGTHHDGRPYAVMPLLSGGTLAAPEVRARYADPDAALELVLAVARAVMRAQQRGVLHCDIKPANVLFTAKAEPFVSDFGLARVLDDEGFVYSARFHGGTPGWMSPEQAQQAQDLTTASDVFSLGVLLYWLLAGELPFGDGADFVRRVQHEPELPLRRRYRGKRAWELEQICARALQKRPEARYASAAELVDDLERVSARPPRAIAAERRRPLRRLLKLMRAHVLASLAAVELCMLLLYLPLMPISVLREVKSTVREQLEYSARAQAGAVMNELRALARRVEQLALEPDVQRMLAHPDVYRVPPELVAHTSGGLDGLSVFTAQGVLRARFPEPSVPHPTLDFGFRDYIQGQLRIAQYKGRDVYVARPFHSTGDDELMLGLSTPFYDARSHHIGALAGRVRVRATFGAVQMNCGGERLCMTALLGSRDRDHDDPPPDVRTAARDSSIYVLASPGLADGQELKIEEPLATTIRKLPYTPAARDQFAPSTHPLLVLDDYEDPVSHARSMAVLAPVGGTGLIVVVATPHDALAVISGRMTDGMKRYLWVPLVIGLLLLAGLVAWPALAERPWR